MHGCDSAEWDTGMYQCMPLQQLCMRQSRLTDSSHAVDQPRADLQDTCGWWFTLGVRVVHTDRGGAGAGMCVSLFVLQAASTHVLRAL